MCKLLPCGITISILLAEFLVSSLVSLVQITVDEIKDHLYERREEASVTTFALVVTHVGIRLLGELWLSSRRRRRGNLPEALRLGGEFVIGVHTRTDAHTRVRMHLRGALPMIYVYR